MLVVDLCLSCWYMFKGCIHWPLVDMLLIIIQAATVSRAKSHNSYSEDQSKVGVFANFAIFFPYFSMKRYTVTPSLEPSHRDGSNDGSQCIFLVRNK